MSRIHRGARRAQRPAGLAEAVLMELDAGVLACDADGALVIVNDRAWELLGGRSRFNTDRPEQWAERHRVRAGGADLAPEDFPLRRALRGEVVPGVRLEVRLEQGGTRVIDATARPLRDGDGAITGAWVMMRDVTGQVTEEADLRRRAAATDALPAGILLVRDADGSIVYANPAAEQLFGYQPGELVGRHISTVNALTDEVPEDRAERIVGTLRRGGRWEGRLESVRKDGTAFWSAATAAMGTGEALDGIIVAAHRDATAQHAELVALEEERDALRTIVEAAPVGLLSYDADLRIRSANLHLHRLTGRRPGELVGLALAAVLHPDDVQRTLDQARRALATPPADDAGRARLVTPEGEVRGVSMSFGGAVPVGGEPYGIIAMLADEVVPAYP